MPAPLGGPSCARLFTFGLAALAIGCGSSDGAVSDDPPSAHPEWAPANGGAGGTERDLLLSGSTGPYKALPPDGSETFGATDPTQLPGCSTYAEAGGAVMRTSVASSNVTVAASRADEAFALGLLPPPQIARLDDFFNLFSDPASEAQTPADLSISMKLRERAIPSQYDLLVGVRAPILPRPRSVLTVLVDTTPSMAGTALARAGYALGALAKALGPGDSVTLLTTNPAAGVQRFDSFGDGSALSLAANGLFSSDQADVPGALVAAYQKANDALDPAAVNRVVFISDGAEPESVLPTAEIAAAAKKGLFLVGVGVGPTTTYGERLLAQATSLGRGSNVFVSSLASANRQLGDRYDQVMGVAYDKVHLELTLPWFLKMVQAPPTGGTPGQSAEPYLAPGASLTFLFRVQVCNPSVFAYGSDSPITAVVQFVDPKTQLAGERSSSLVATHLEESESAPQLDKALAIESYVEALRSLDGKRVQRAQERVARCFAEDPDVKVMKGHLELMAELIPPG